MSCVLTATRVKVERGEGFLIRCCKMAHLSMQNNLSELDAMLQDLSNSRSRPKSGASSVNYGDYYSDYSDFKVGKKNIITKLDWS